MVIIIFKMKPHLSKRRIIWRIESIKMFSAEFCGPVTSCQLIVEINADFRDNRLSRFPGSSYFNRGDKIFPAVGTQKTNREL